RLLHEEGRRDLLGRAIESALLGGAVVGWRAGGGGARRACHARERARRAPRRGGCALQQRRHAVSHQGTGRNAGVVPAAAGRVVARVVSEAAPPGLVRLPRGRRGDVAGPRERRHGAGRAHRARSGRIVSHGNPRRGGCARRQAARRVHHRSRRRRGLPSREAHGQYGFHAGLAEGDGAGDGGTLTGRAIEAAPYGPGFSSRYAAIAFSRITMRASCSARGRLISPSRSIPVRAMASARRAEVVPSHAASAHPCSGPPSNASVPNSTFSGHSPSHWRSTPASSPGSTKSEIAEMSA